MQTRGLASVAPKVRRSSYSTGLSFGLRSSPMSGSLCSEISVSEISRARRKRSCSRVVRLPGFQRPQPKPLYLFSVISQVRFALFRQGFGSFGEFLIGLSHPSLMKTGVAWDYTLCQRLEGNPRLRLSCQRSLDRIHNPFQRRGPVPNAVYRRLRAMRARGAAKAFYFNGRFSLDVVTGIGRAKIEPRKARRSYRTGVDAVTVRAA